MDSVDRLDEWPASETAGGQSRAGGKRVSERDSMYGSKLSTRMQDGARSAWKASRKFASSVVTGRLVGGGFSSCTKRGAGGPKAADSMPADLQVAATHEQPTIQQQPGRKSQVCEHTSVVEVGPKGAGDSLPAELLARQLAQSEGRPVSSSQQVAAAGEESAVELATEAASAQTMVRVDGNNKLTIVTKFNQLASEQERLESEQQASCGASGERSRCASSSSGRGTASQPESDASVCSHSEQADEQLEVRGPHSSLASPEQQQQQQETVVGGLLGDQKSQQLGKSAQMQDKEQLDKQRQRQLQPISPAISSSSSGCSASTSSNEQQNERRHRRRSSIFKTSRVFSGSQASLNKLRSFFAVASSSVQTEQKEQQFQVADDETETNRGAPLQNGNGCGQTLETGVNPAPKLNGQALEDLLRKSGQGGQSAAHSNGVEMEIAANLADKEEIWKKCQDQPGQKKKQTNVVHLEVDYKQPMAEQPIELRSA